MNDKSAYIAREKDYNRNILAWVVLLIVLFLLLIIRPSIAINQTSMVLPLDVNLQSLDQNDVKAINGYYPINLANNYVGYITVTTPIVANNNKSSFNAIAEAKYLAAKAGGNVLVYRTYESPWFMTNNKVLRLQADILRK